MEKRTARQFLRELRVVKSWYFLVAAVLCGVLCVYALRQNNLRMIALRQQVNVADEQNGDVETALRILREYVYAHMNTDLTSGASAIKPPIQLKYRYERLQQAEQQRVSAETSKVYTDAQSTCEQQYPQSFSGGPRVPCIANYVATHVVTSQIIPDSLYKFDFVSPSWTPDVAGWSLVAATILLFFFVVRLALEQWLESRMQG